ncbi:MAG: abortive infection protein [Ignavibacteriales bacterium]|nr:MAG: abortive infection protein [Ignavibacteriales bacterium]
MSRIEIKGINYDVGVRHISDTDLPYSKMIEEIKVIKNELHCNAVRIYGRDLDKLIECSKIVMEEGLAVWFSPRCINATFKETLEYIHQCSVAAEELRKYSSGIVYVIGNEFSLDLKGLIEGDTTSERILNLAKPISILKNIFGSGLHNALNGFLKEAVTIARDNFHGEITYASGEWEKVNWELFDITAINYYKNIFNSWKYRRTVRKFSQKDKRFAVTEFGCCSYKGADKKGAWGYSIVDWNRKRPSLKKVFKRDEGVQANYIIDLLNIYLNENVYAAFVYTFVARKSKYNSNPEYDLDMANFGLIKVLSPDNKDLQNPYLWERKKAFNELSEFYSVN